MGTRSFDDEIAQVPSRDGADRHFAPNIYINPKKYFHNSFALVLPQFGMIYITLRSILPQSLFQKKLKSYLFKSGFPHLSI